RLLRTLRAVLRATLLTVGDTSSVERTTHDVITNTRQILHTSATNEHDGVFLQLVTFTRNVRCDFDAIAQTNTGDLTQRGVRLLGGHGTDNGTNAAFLRRALILAEPALLEAVQGELQSRSLAFYMFILASLADHLIYCRHNQPPISI